MLAFDMLPRFAFTVKVFFEDYIFCTDQPKLGENTESKMVEVETGNERERKRKRKYQLLQVTGFDSVGKSK